MTTKIKPLSWVKANASEILRNFEKDPGPFIITQNGEARAVLMDYYDYEQQQERLALMQILEIGRQQVREGKSRPADEVFDEVMAELAEK